MLYPRDTIRTTPLLLGDYWNFTIFLSNLIITLILKKHFKKCGLDKTEWRIVGADLFRRLPLLEDLKNAHNSSTSELFQSAIQPLVLPSVKDWIPTQQLTFEISVVWRCALLTNENVWVYKNMAVHTLMGCTRHADVSKAIRRRTHNWHFGLQKLVGVFLLNLFWWLV